MKHALTRLTALLFTPIGGGRRSWVKGIQDVSKLHLIKCMAFNLGLLMRQILGSGKPRQLADALRPRIAARTHLDEISGHQTPTTQTRPFFNGLLWAVCRDHRQSGILRDTIKSRLPHPRSLIAARRTLR